MTSARVVHLITKLELGGAQRNTLLTVERLPRHGFDAQIWYGPGGILTPLAEALPGHREIPCLQRQIHPRHDRKALSALEAQLRTLRPDILHTHSSKAGFLGRMAASRCAIPVVIHSVHGFPFSPLQSFARRRLFMLAEKLAARWTSHFVFVSRSDQQTAIRLGLCRHNHSLIRSGFDLLDYRPRPELRKSARRRFSLPENAFVIGIVAPFKPQKGLFQLIKVAKKVHAKDPKAIFFLAGDGALRPQLEAAIHRAGLDAQFRLPGFLNDLPEIMDAFDVGLSTALWEGLPQSLVQLRLKQIPIVASLIPGNNEVVRNNENGFLVSPHSTEAFAHGILTLMNDPSLRKRMGHAPEDFADWDAERMVNNQASLYARLLSGNSAAAMMPDFPSSVVP